jgi:hypothetical protein
LRGGSHTVTGERISMPEPKFIVTATGLPPCSSNSPGTIQDEIPGPVARACQTSSGVPDTSTSTWGPESGGFFPVRANVHREACSGGKTLNRLGAWTSWPFDHSPRIPSVAHQPFHTLFGFRRRALLLATG